MMGHALIIAGSYCDDECVAHLSLVGKEAAAEHEGADVVLFDHGVVGLQLLRAFLAETDVEGAQLSDVRLELWEEECQLGLLQRQRVGCSDDVRAYIISIVLRHQTGRHIEAHHLGRRAVDILH